MLWRRLLEALPVEAFSERPTSVETFALRIRPRDPDDPDRTAV